MSNSAKMFGIVLASAILLNACAPTVQPATPTTESGSSEPSTGIEETPGANAAPDLQAIKTYLIDKGTSLKENTSALKAAADKYYELAKAANFDYAALWTSNAAEAQAAITEGRNAWTTSSPLYEQMEGIVAGTPSLAEFDVILDAGAAGDEDPDAAVPFDLTLPDGRTLPKPGNLFGVTESTLWGTFDTFTADVEADWDGDATVEFGEALPDANVLKAAADALDSYTVEMNTAIAAWEPTESDAFTALVVMVPTMSEYFNSWKNSRFVMGEASTQRDFVALSRLGDIQDILGSLQVVYASVKPLAASADAAQAAQIEQGLADLKAFVADVHTKEKNGQKFSPEEADLLGAEAQNRAAAIAGQVAQIAAMLNIKIEE